MAQQKLPVIVVGAGLPQLRGQVGRATSYAERLFDFPAIGPLTNDAARGYPYFLQEWGKHTWDAADDSPITGADVLGMKVTSLGPTRNNLIKKGMIWSPNHGDTAFTVPLFDEFMHRIMPGEEWRTN